MIIGSKRVGIGQPTYIVAEGGINHNGDIEIAYKLVDAAAEAGANAIKFQKRTPRLATPRAEWDKVRDTPWGLLSYIEYREKIELDITEHSRLMKRAHSLGLGFIDSVWDMQSLADVIGIGVDAIKIPSAMLTNLGLIESSITAMRPVILSTGMSTAEEISTAVSCAQDKAESKSLAVLHCTSTYPCDPAELNLLAIMGLQLKYPNLVIGYSNHSPGIIAAVSAVTLGAKIVEAHITLDRTAWGTDQAASIEPGGFKRMVDYIRTTEKSLGDGIKKVYNSELSSMLKLRGTV